MEALGKNDNLQKDALRGVLVHHTEVQPNVVNTNRRVYIEELLLQPIKLSICYTPVGRYKEVGQVTGAVRSVLNIFGGFAKVDADVTLQSYIAKNVADNSNMFANRVGKHYETKLLQQVARRIFVCTETCTAAEESLEVHVKQCSLRCCPALLCVVRFIVSCLDCKRWEIR